MSLEANIWAWEQFDGLSMRGKVVLLALADYVKPDGRTCWPSQRHLAHKCQLSERTIREALTDLERAELIKRHPRMRGEGRGRTSDLIELYGPMFCHEDFPEDSRTNRQPTPEGRDATFRQIQGDQPADGPGESLRESLKRPPHVPPKGGSSSQRRASGGRRRRGGPPSRVSTDIVAAYDAKTRPG